MNEDKMKGQWNQISGKAKEKWGQLTDDDMQQIDGKRDQLVGKVQERYGIAKDEAEKQVKDFEDANA
ncbi:MAG: CsbD family protein [Dehalococcoidia bacterium]|nr:CsbD family protein [Dehalococcoidia bacterium]MCB9483774.1 CsbD family protein [Dehalococcoidia bacterium]MCB9491991.1 CsbD family protein [Dehalococcoidia bacterium]